MKMLIWQSLELLHLAKWNLQPSNNLVDGQWTGHSAGAIKNRGEDACYYQSWDFKVFRNFCFDKPKCHPLPLGTAITNTLSDIRFEIHLAFEHVGISCWDQWFGKGNIFRFRKIWLLRAMGFPINLGTHFFRFFFFAFRDFFLDFALPILLLLCFSCLFAFVVFLLFLLFSVSTVLLCFSCFFAFSVCFCFSLFVFLRSLLFCFFCFFFYAFPYILLFLLFRL